MDSRELLSKPPKILTREQREQYLKEGYCAVPGLVGEDWLAPLRELTAGYIEESRGAEPGDARFDLDSGHGPEEPRLRRLNSPVDLDERYWRFASEGPIVDVAEDLLGPDFKYHHSKLNFKWREGGEEVKWHQDIQFWPHTNYDVLTIGVYLDDVDDDMAPMGVIPGSHDGPLFDQYDAADPERWAGYIRDEDLPHIPLEQARYIRGPAGTVTVHNCRTIHGSAPNLSSRSRPLLLNAYSAADALPILNAGGHGKGETLVRGVPARWIRYDPRPCLRPPDFTKVGYRSIFASQQGES